MNLPARAACILLITLGLLAPRIAGPAATNWDTLPRLRAKASAPAAPSRPPAALPQPRAARGMAGADPHVARLGNRYWMYPTGQGGSGPANPVFYAYSSPDLRTWRKHGPVLQFKDVSWIYADGEPRHYAWAPAIAERGGRYYFYYAVGLQGRTPSRIGVAVGRVPSGPFKDKGEPLLTGGQGFEAIDPMVFRDPVSRKHYLYAGGSAGRKLRLFELSRDMLHLAREIPVETPPRFTEAAFVHHRKGIYYLSYSHGRWNDPNYSVHYATSRSPLGPWEYRGQILGSDATRKAPGHHSFIRHHRTGEWFIVYHRWQSPTGGDPFKAGRSIAIDRVHYGANGQILPITMTDEGLPVLEAAKQP